MGTGWYVAHNEVFDERIEVTGDVSLILADGCTLNANDGIHVQNSGSLTIWAQSVGDGMGALEAKGKTGIGANPGENMDGDVTINGGKVNATGSNYGAGIGVCQYGELNGNITIAGGEVTASSPKFSAGIGTGNGGRLKGNITISGGNVTATGHNMRGVGIGVGPSGELSGTITISGGEVNATGETGIGACYDANISKSGRILITDGTVVAKSINAGAGIDTGGRDSNNDSDSLFGTIEIRGGDVTAKSGYMGAGIGAGYKRELASSSTIRITGGKVDAEGGIGGSGIGSGGLNSVYGTIEISGGDVTATGRSAKIDGEKRSGAGIGAGIDGNFNGTLIITGCTVKATGDYGAAGIGAGRGGNASDGHVLITGSTVIAKGGTGAADIGGGKEGTSGEHSSSGAGGEGCDDVRIIRGTVFAQSGEGICSAIGHGEDDGHMGNITFSDLLRVQTDSRTDGGIDGPYNNREGNPHRVDERDGACMYNHTALISACDHPMDAGINDSLEDITETDHRRAACVYCGHALQREEHTLDEENKCTVCGYQGTVYTVSFDANGGSGTMGVMKTVPERALILPECGFTAPEAKALAGKAFAGWEIDDHTYEAGKPVQIYRDTTAKALWARSYQLWVGGTHVTEDNAGDILGDGTASYDRLSNTLTLKGAWINKSAVYDRAEGLSAGIIDGMGQLRIVVEGNSVVNAADADHGIYSIGEVSISGKGRLSVRGKDGIGTGGDLDISVARLTATGDRYGVNAAGNITIYDSTVDAAGGEIGLKATKNIGVNGESSVVTARASQIGGQAVQANLDIGFDSFLAIVMPTGGTVGAGTDGVTILDGNGNTAREVMISKNLPYDVWVGETQVTSDNYRNVLRDGSVSYDPDSRTLTFVTNAPEISGTHGNAMIYTGHDLTVVAPEGGLTLENADTPQGIDAAGDLTLRGNVTINVMNQAILAGENFTAHGDLTARGMGSALTAEGLIEANCSITLEGDLKGYNKTGYGLRAGGDAAINGSVKLNAATGTTISAGGSINIAGSLDNTIFDGQARVATNGLAADGDIYVGGKVSLLASNTGIRSENGSINVLSGRWELNNGTYGTVAMDAVSIYFPETHEIVEPTGGAVSIYTDGDATRETISSDGNTAAYAVIDRKSDAPTDMPAVPTVQVTPESAELTYGGAEDESRTLTAAATVEPETGLGMLTYRWQRQEENGSWQTVASGVDMTEYAVPTEAAAGEYTSRCQLINTLNGASEQAESNEVIVTIAKAVPEIIAESRPISLTYNGKPQRLAMCGSVNGGKLQYSLDGESWSGSVPTATNAGTYTMYYRVRGDESHSDLAGGVLEVSIAKRRLVITVEGKEKMLGEADPELTCLVEGLMAGDMLEGQLTREAGEEVGTYLISAQAIQPADYCKENYTLVPQGNVLTILAREFGTPDFTMPAQLTEIGESAFEGLSEMKVVDAHSCTTIGKDAFNGSGLVRIRLAKDFDIDAEAFGNRKIYIFAPAGGTTEAYCAGHNNLVFRAE